MCHERGNVENCCTTLLGVTKNKVSVNPALSGHALLCTVGLKPVVSILVIYDLTDLFTGTQ